MLHQALSPLPSQPPLCFVLPEMGSREAQQMDDYRATLATALQHVIMSRFDRITLVGSAESGVMTIARAMPDRNFGAGIHYDPLIDHALFFSWLRNIVREGVPSQDLGTFLLDGSPMLRGFRIAELHPYYHIQAVFTDNFEWSELEKAQLRVMRLFQMKLQIPGDDERQIVDLFASPIDSLPKGAVLI